MSELKELPKEEQIGVLKVVKLSAKQKKYQATRKRRAQKIDKLIETDYINLAKQNKSKSYIMDYLRDKYRNSQGYSFSKQRIYNALDLRKIYKNIRAMQGCNPLLGA